jgi:hypothetical protein
MSNTPHQGAFTRLFGTLGKTGTTEPAPTHTKSLSRPPAGSSGSSPGEARPALRDPFQPAKAASGEPQAAAAAPLSLEFLVRQWRAADRHASRDAIKLGDFADRWIRKRMQEDRNVEREEIVREIRAELERDGLAGSMIDVNRFIAVHWVARLFGADQAEQMQLSALRAFCRLIRRHKQTGEWMIRPDVKGKACDLWVWSIADKPTVAKIRAAVESIRTRKARRKSAHRSRAKRARLFRQVSFLGVEECQELISLAERRLQTLAGAQKVAA